MNVNAAMAGLSRRTGLDPTILGLIAFFVAHMLIRIFGTSNFSVDETETALHVQVFQLYYSLRNPPLFDWLFFGLGQVTGVNVVTMQILKTGLLAGAGVFFFLALRPAFRHRAALDAAVVAYGATAFYGWDVFQQFSHTIALIFAMAFTFWAAMRVIRLARTVDYVLLGISLGLGILSKYLFVLFFVALLVAALRRPAYRPAILSWRMTLTLIVATIVVSPLLVGLWDARDALFGTLGGRVAGAESGPDIGSFGFLILLTAEFWLPFAAILWASLARWPAASMGEGPVAVSVSTGQADDDFFPFLRDATAIMVAAMLASFLFLGTEISDGRYLVVILSLLPAAVFAAIDRHQAFPEEALRHFRQGAMIFIVGIAVIRFATFLFVSPPFCVPRCVLFVDYSRVAEKIGAADGKQTVILTDHLHIGANLLRLVPNAKVVMDAYTGGSDLSIAAPADRNCYFVWFQRYRSADEEPIETALQQGLRRPPLSSEIASIGPVESVTVDWQTKILPEWGPETVVGIAKIDSAEPICDGGRISGLSPPPTNNSIQ